MFFKYDCKKTVIFLLTVFLLTLFFTVAAFAEEEPVTQPVIIYQSEDNALKAWLMEEEKRVGYKVFEEVEEGWKVRGIIDADGDGHPDIYLYHPEEGLAKLWLMDGTEKDEVIPIGNPDGTPDIDPRWDMKALHDLNNSGEPDIIWQADDGELAIWLMKAYKAYDYGRILNFDGTTSVEPDWEIGAVFDLLGDDEPEIIWQAIGGEHEDQLAYWKVDMEEPFEAKASDRIYNHPNDPSFDADWQLNASVDLFDDGIEEFLFHHVEDDLAYWQLDVDDPDWGVIRDDSGRLEPGEVGEEYRLVGAAEMIIDKIEYVENATELEQALDNEDVNTIILADGTYEGSFTVEYGQTLRAENKGEAIIKLKEASATPAISIEADEVTIDGLQIVRSQQGEENPGYAQGIRVSGSNIEIVNNHVTGKNIVDAAGIDIFGDKGTTHDNIKVANNVVEGFAMHKLSQQNLNAGIKICAWYEDSLIDEVTITENTVKNNMYGITRVAEDGIFEKVLIEDNTYENNIAGEVGPVSDRVPFEERQQPFLSRTEESGLGPPLIDNFDEIGMPVTGKDDTVLGYSNNCSALSRIDFYYYSTETGNFEKVERLADIPEDEVAEIETIEGETADLIVRVETGTINRFIYGIAMLVSSDGTPAEEWSDRLVYNFGGGVGIGNTQDELSLGNVLLEDFLAQGYAVAHSTGNITSNHYNILRHVETARLVKEHFVEKYGDPLYTVGRGGSGGAIQQHMIAQNEPGILDGILPAAAYPDMVTQTIHVGDGMLMEYYMDLVYPTLPPEERWEDFDETRWISYEDREVFHGLPGNDEMEHPFWDEHPTYGTEKGASAFMEAWGGLPQLALNPFFQKGFPDSGLYADLVEAFGEEKLAATEFTHFNDLREIYGVDEYGWAKTTWDNTGVQYGLQSYREGEVTKEEFLDLNKRIGGWKHTSEFELPDFPWDHENQQPERTEGNVEAIQKAYEEGVVFIGDVDIPIIDYRLYLDPVLDMHHFRESFTTRERLEMNQGHAKNQLIWVSHMDNPDYEEIIEKAYFEVMDQWLLNIIENPEKSVIENRPEKAEDKAWDEDGEIFASGDDIWEEGEEAYERFTPYSTSRMLADSPTHGLMFKPELIEVEEAFDRGYYGDPGDFDEDDKETLIEALEKIFPNGVADYDQPCKGMPESVREELDLD